MTRMTRWCLTRLRVYSGQDSLGQALDSPDGLDMVCRALSQLILRRYQKSPLNFIQKASGDGVN
jgi:hypothetical protein